MRPYEIATVWIDLNEVIAILPVEHLKVHAIGSVYLRGLDKPFLLPLGKTKWNTVEHRCEEAEVLWAKLIEAWMNP